MWSLIDRTPFLFPAVDAVSLVIRTPSHLMYHCRLRPSYQAICMRSTTVTFRQQPLRAHPSLLRARLREGTASLGQRGGVLSAHGCVMLWSSGSSRWRLDGRLIQRLTGRCSIVRRSYYGPFPPADVTTRSSLRPLRGCQLPSLL